DVGFGQGDVSLPRTDVCLPLSDILPARLDILPLHPGKVASRSGGVGIPIDRLAVRSRRRPACLDMLRTWCATEPAARVRGSTCAARRPFRQVDLPLAR